MWGYSEIDPPLFHIPGGKRRPADLCRLCLLDPEASDTAVRGPSHPCEDFPSPCCSALHTSTPRSSSESASLLDFSEGYLQTTCPSIGSPPRSCKHPSPSTGHLLQRPLPTVGVSRELGVSYLCSPHGPCGRRRYPLTVVWIGGNGNLRRKMQGPGGLT